MSICPAKSMPYGKTPEVNASENQIVEVDESCESEQKSPTESAPNHKMLTFGNNNNNSSLKPQSKPTSNFNGGLGGFSSGGTGFGSNANNNNTWGFGSSNSGGFGSANSNAGSGSNSLFSFKNGNSGFGQPSNKGLTESTDASGSAGKLLTTGFGSSNSSSFGFGSNNQNHSQGGFGFGLNQSNSNKGFGFGFGSKVANFGSNTNNANEEVTAVGANGGVFAQKKSSSFPAASLCPSSGSSFGQPQPKVFGGFGSSSSFYSYPSFNSNNSSFGFGTTNVNDNPFGSPTTASTPASGGSIWGTAVQVNPSNSGFIADDDNVPFEEEDQHFPSQDSDFFFEPASQPCHISSSNVVTHGLSPFESAAAAGEMYVDPNQISTNPFSFPNTEPTGQPLQSVEMLNINPSDSSVDQESMSDSESCVTSSEDESPNDDCSNVKYDPKHCDDDWQSESSQEGSQESAQIVINKKPINKKGAKLCQASQSSSDSSEQSVKKKIKIKKKPSNKGVKVIEELSNVKSIFGSAKITNNDGVIMAKKQLPKKDQAFNFSGFSSKKGQANLNGITKGQDHQETLQEKVETANKAKSYESKENNKSQAQSSFVPKDITPQHKDSQTHNKGSSFVGDHGPQKTNATDKASSSFEPITYITESSLFYNPIKVKSEQQQVKTEALKQMKKIQKEEDDDRLEEFKQQNKRLREEVLIERMGKLELVQKQQQKRIGMLEHQNKIYLDLIRGLLKNQNEHVPSFVKKQSPCPQSQHQINTASSLEEVSKLCISNVTKNDSIKTEGSLMPSNPLLTKQEQVQLQKDQIELEEAYIDSLQTELAEKFDVKPFNSSKIEGKKISAKEQQELDQEQLQMIIKMSQSPHLQEAKQKLK